MLLPVRCRDSLRQLLGASPGAGRVLGLLLGFLGLANAVGSPWEMSAGSSTARWASARRGEELSQGRARVVVVKNSLRWDLLAAREVRSQCQRVIRVFEEAVSILMDRSRHRFPPTVAAVIGHFSE